ncbi:MAG TPA: XrtA system polysaccharide chain length determinant [Rhodanobacteraceae bacterium]|nr:XrtA system polysaccharide chain length determinant [Rhodanobacteraceae bacterium]
MSNELIAAAPPPLPATVPFNVATLAETMLKEARRRRVMLAVIFAAIALLALVIGVFWPKKFVAETTILVQQNNVIKPLTEGIAATTEAASRAEIAREIIFSQDSLDQLLADGGWNPAKLSPIERDKLVDRIKAHTTITGSNSDLLLNISYDDSDPARAYNLTRDMAQLFISKSLASKEAESASAYNFMNSQVEEYHQKMVAASDALQQYIASHPDASPGSIADTNARISALRSQIENAKVQAAQFGSQAAAMGGSLSGQSQISTVQTREDVYRAQIAQLQSHLSELLLTYTDNYPDVVRTRHQIEDLQQQLASAQAQKKTAASVGTAIDSQVTVNPVYSNLQTELAQIRGQLAAAHATETASQQQLEIELARSQKIAESSNELTKLTNNFNALSTTYQDLLKRREQARISMDLDKDKRGLTFKIQDPARMPLMPVGLRLMHFAAAGMLLGVCVPLGLLFLIARFDPRARSADALARATGLPVFASVPYYRGPHDDALDRKHNLQWIGIVVIVLVAYVALYLIRVARHI